MLSAECDALLIFEYQSGRTPQFTVLVNKYPCPVDF